MAVTQNFSALAILTDARARLQQYESEMTDPQALAQTRDAAISTAAAIKKLSKAIARQLDVDNT